MQNVVYLDMYDEEKDGEEIWRQLCNTQVQ